MKCLIYDFHFEFNEIDHYSSKQNNKFLNLLYFETFNSLKKGLKPPKINPKKRFKEYSKHQNKLNFGYAMRL